MCNTIKVSSSGFYKWLIRPQSTYIKTASGWTYLTTVIDLADRKVVGWSFSNDMTAGNTTVKALAMAIKNRGIKPGLIFHSDRGIQYACDEFKLMLNKNGIKQNAYTIINFSTGRLQS